MIFGGLHKNKNYVFPLMLISPEICDLIKKSNQTTENMLSNYKFLQHLSCCGNIEKVNLALVEKLHV